MAAPNKLAPVAGCEVVVVVVVVGWAIADEAALPNKLDPPVGLFPNVVPPRVPKGFDGAEDAGVSFFCPKPAKILLVAGSDEVGAAAGWPKLPKRLEAEALGAPAIVEGVQRKRDKEMRAADDGYCLRGPVDDRDARVSLW